MTIKTTGKKIIAGAVSSALLLGMIPTAVFANADELVQAAAAQATAAQKIDSLTIQPGETTASINLNWYAPAGTTNSVLQFATGEEVTTYAALEFDLHKPTELIEGKYKDTGKVGVQATAENLAPDTTYTYKISNDGGATWSEEYKYKTPAKESFKFAFTSDPQIKDKESAIDDRGWNPSDGTNQTGWAKMMEAVAEQDVTLMVSAGDQVEDQSWGKSSEYDAFFAPEEMSRIAYAPAVGNHDRHYMFDDHFNLPNEMAVAEDGEKANSDELEQVKTTFRGQNSGTSLSHGNYTQATTEEITNKTATNGVTPNENGMYDYPERRKMETKGNYYYLYNNVLFVTLNTGAYPGGNDALEGENPNLTSAQKKNEAEGIIDNFEKTIKAAKEEYNGKYDWIVVAHHKSTQTVAKHAADSDIENYVDAGFEQLMYDEDVDFVLGGHDHVYSRSYVLNGKGERVSERLDTINDPQGVIYLTGNCSSDMQYYTPFEKVDKENNVDYPVLANGQKGSAAYLKGAKASDAEKAGYLPVGNQEWNQEYSPSYALFDVNGDTISVKVYNLSGNSDTPVSKEIDAFTVTKNKNGGAKATGKENGNTSLNATQIARYDSGMTNADGGVMEIVDYNNKTGWAYAVNGDSGKLTAIPLEKLEKGDTVKMLDGNDIDVKALVNDKSFTYGDMTSVAVSPNGTMLAAAVQAEGYAANGRVVLFQCNDDGTLTFQQAIETGVQPDMVTFTPDGSKILTANEGEPRQGYGKGATDPAGSVTIVDVASKKAQTVGFEKFDHNTLAQAGIVLKKDASPANDLEPEYIAADDNKAYVTLQEANAIAVLDLNSKAFTGIYSAGFEDYSKVAVDIDKKDEAYNAKTYDSLRGIRMPDGISMYQANGKTYLLTANEGDSREWGDEEAGTDYLNEDERNFGKEQKSPTGKITAENSGLTGKVVFFDSKDYDGLDDDKDYLFGGRSFTLFEVTDNGLTEVFDSGNDFEAKTAAYLPKYFNCSNDDLTVDDRSGKKGPEAETVVTGQVGDKTYAFVTLERIGGVMMYDITNPAQAKFVNYINSRDFSAAVAADDSPEGLKFIAAEKSPTGKAMLLAACEVGGTVAAYELTAQNTSGSGSSSSSGGFSGTYNYPVKMDSTANATVSLSKNNAVAGDKVTITVTPKQGQQVDTVIITDAAGKQIAVAKEGDNKYSFVMPASAVKLEVTTKASVYDKKIVLQINNKAVTVNGKSVQSDVAPIIVDNRTMVPIRVITETLGGTVDWNNRTVTLNIDGKLLQMTIGQTIPGFDAAPILKNNRTYVPVRYVAEALGADVAWDETTQQITITK